MEVPFTWRPTGWFQVLWSGELGVGEVRPMQWFGQHLVAYRDEGGVAHVLDAHCPHLGAHLGFGGTVKGECVICPYHGWGWGPDGMNQFIPYEDRPNRSQGLRVWPVKEQCGIIFMWQHPEGLPPSWDLPTVFDAFPNQPATEDDYYRAYPELTDRWEREPIHPQIPMENAPDGIHFRYVHSATVDPVLIDFEVGKETFRTHIGWPVPAADGGTRNALEVRNVNFGVGGTYSIFSGAGTAYRLALFTTPVDNTCSTMFYSIWWPRGEDRTGEAVPSEIGDRVRRTYLQTPEQDYIIWRNQIYIEHPALAQRDARPYKALRTWAKQFYDEEPVRA